MATAPTQVVFQFIDEVWNRKRLDLVPKLIKSDYQVDGRLVAASQVCENVMTFHSAFANLSLTIVESVTAGEAVATLVQIEGTHVGSWKGIPASGRTIDYREAAFWHVSEGRIASGVFIAESLTLRVKLGQIPDRVWQGSQFT